MMSYRQLLHKETIRRSHNRSFHLVCDGLTNPVNTGMLFRLADGFGFQALHLCSGTPTPWNKKLRKAARTTTESIEWDQWEKASDALHHLKNQGFILIGLEITDHSTDLRDFNFKTIDKAALVIGAERHGISEEALSIMDYCLEIPLFGRGSSLNVATAASIAMYEMTRFSENILLNNQ